MMHIITVTKGREVVKEAVISTAQMKRELENMELLGYVLVDNGRGKGFVTDGKGRGRTFRKVTPTGEVKLVNIKKA